MSLTALVGTLLRASELGKMILPQRSAAMTAVTVHASDAP
jgi:hypothetical protein